MGRTPKEQRDTRAVRRAKGICLHCDEPAVNGQSLCGTHKAANQASVRKMRAERAAMNMCMRCTEPRAPGKVFCPQHMSVKAAEYRARVERRKKAGLCIECENPAVPGESMCERHKAKRRAATDRYRKKKPQVIVVCLPSDEGGDSGNQGNGRTVS